MSKGKVYIQNIEDSEERPNIYIWYDRAYIGNKRYLWMSWCGELAQSDPGPVYFYSEHEAREWIEDSLQGHLWTSTISKLYLIELDSVISTQILLSNNKQEKLKELTTEEVIEELWLQQHGRSLNDSPK